MTNRCGLLKRVGIADRYFLGLWLLGFAFGCEAGGGPAVSVCNLTLAYGGPTEVGTFAGLDEDAAQCAASSWREVYETQSIPEGSLFVSSSCQQGQEGDGSLDNPYCDLASAFREAAQRDFGDAETVAVIHVDPGEYTVAETINTPSMRVALTGLCSTQTTLKTASSDSALMTLEAENGSVKVEGVTLEGGSVGIVDIRQGSFSLANVHVKTNNDNECFSVEGVGGSLTGQNVEMDGNSVNSLVFQRPTETDTGDATVSMLNPQPDTPVCVHVGGGGRLQMENFHFHDFSGVAVLVEDAGSEASLENGVIDGIYPLATDGNYGYGFVVQSGATATLNEVTVSNTSGAGVMADDADTSITLTSSHISAVSMNIVSDSGVGVIIQRGAQATVKNSEIEDNAGPGFYVSGGGTATVDASSLRGNPFNAAVVDATLTLTDSTLAEAQPSSFSGRVGVFIESFTPDNDVTATLTGNIIRDNPSAGVYLYEASGGGMTVNLEGNHFIDNGTLSSYNWSAAFMDLATGISLAKNCFQAQGNVAMILHDSNALLSENIYEGAYDTFVIQHQACNNYDAPVSPYQNPVDVTGEVVVSGSPHCLCGSRTDTGETCSTMEHEPRLMHDFGVGEVTLAP